MLGIFPELERNNNSMNTGTIPICCEPAIIVVIVEAIAVGQKPRGMKKTSTKLKKLVNGKTIFMRDVLTSKTGLPFQNSVLSRGFSTGTNHKNVYHLHPNRNFREFVVNAKQPYLNPSTLGTDH